MLHLKNGKFSTYAKCEFEIEQSILVNNTNLQPDILMGILDQQLNHYAT